MGLKKSFKLNVVHKEEETTEKENNKNKKDASENNKKKNEDIASYFSLYKYSTCPDKVLIALGTVTSLVGGTTYPLVYLLLGSITESMIKYSNGITNLATNKTDEENLQKELYDSAYVFVWLSVGLGVATFVLQFVGAVCFSYTASRQVFAIRKKFFQKVLNLDVDWYDNNNVDFASNITDNMSKIQDGIGDKVSIFITINGNFITGLIVAFAKGWKLTLVCLVSLPLSVFAMALTTWVTTELAKSDAEAYATASGIAEEALTSIKTVVAFGGQEKESQRYNENVKLAKDTNVLRSLYTSLGNAFIWFVLYACYALSFWYGVTLIIEDREFPYAERVYTPGNVVAVFFCTLSASMQFAQAGPYLETFVIARGAAFQIFKILETRSTINDSKNTGETPQDIKGTIEFKDVHFHYPSRPDVKVLQGFNLKIKPGETVALVGSSGCGKSTVIQLLERFYDPTEGSITVDNMDLKSLNLSWWRSNIGLVGQEPILFDSTISENIRYGNTKATNDQIERASKTANAHEFIKSFPKGYETIVGERGVQLSGGQKQRIAIARALVREPILLLFDEATSALDITSEAKVQKALDVASTGCTTIIVAHRLSTIRNADRIIVMSNGKIVEEGRHEELMASKTFYYQLVSSQNDTAQSNQKKVQHDTKMVQTIQSFGKLELSEVQTQEKNLKISPENSDQVSLFTVLDLNRPELVHILLGSICSIVVAAGLPLFSLLLGDILEVVGNENANYVRSETNKICLYFIIVGVIIGFTTFFQNYSFAVAGENLTMRLRQQMFEALMKQEMAWYDDKENNVGAVCAKLAGETANVQGAAGQRLGTIINSLAMLVISCGLAFFFEWRIALVALCFSPVVLGFFYMDTKMSISGNEVIQKSLETSSKIAVEAINGIKTVASLGCEDVFYENYVEQLKPEYKKILLKTYFRAFVLGITKTVGLFSLPICIYYGTTLMVKEGLGYGDIFKVEQSINGCSWGIANALAFTPNLSKALGAAENILQIIHRVPKIRSASDASTNFWKKGNIDYSNVNFSYPTRPSAEVLKDLDLSILRGSTVALVGSSGCGKSTVIQLLERFYAPISGTISIDKTDIEHTDLTSLRSCLSIVSQEPNLFDKTIHDNIAYGDNSRDVAYDEIVQAAKNANIHNFIASLPLGYNTTLGTRGAQLSGGQKQRIAIARALVRNPKVLLLDEATSALDNESEKVVQEALDSAKKGRTCVTIAHRLSTVRDADVICVMKDGKVTEAGSHRELLEKRGLYYEFYTTQSR